MHPVLILGAGINGAALARELALQGVAVVLVDRSDLASGATAASSRLIHGGLRYLEHGEFSLVAESLAERARLLALAPHLVRPLRLHIPARRRRGGWLTSLARFVGLERLVPLANRERGLWLIRLGLTFYDFLARGGSLPRHRVTRVRASSRPRLAPSVARWLVSYSDAQVLYPERFTLALLEDARSSAAALRTPFVFHSYAQVRVADRRAILTNRAGQTVAEYEPAAIVNATGAWVDRALAQLPLVEQPLMAPTKGSHLVLDWPWLGDQLGGEGVYLEASDGRPVFILPCGDLQLVGTTDLPWNGDPSTAQTEPDETRYLLDVIQRTFAPPPGSPKAASRVLFHYCGVRPLPAAQGSNPGAVTRRHWLQEHTSASVPTWSLIGGKLTTCRSLAESAADAILERLNLPRATDTRERMLPGGEGLSADDAARLAWRRSLAQRHGVSLPTVATLERLVGARADGYLQALANDDDRALVADTDLPRGVVRQVIRHEWVTTLGDLVERRLMLLYDRRLSRRTLDELAELLAAEGLVEPAHVQAHVASTITQLAARYGRTPRET